MNNKIKTFGKKILGNNSFGRKILSCLRGTIFCIYKKRLIPNKAGIFYQINEETGLIDVEDRKNAGPFEFPDMIVANRTIGLHFLTSDIHKVVNIGSGVATFETQNAADHPDVFFLASEMDKTSTDWARTNRPFPNVKYCTNSMEDILNKEGKFDLAVTIDVIEHVADYKSFLDEFSKLADKAVISTPNRDRHASMIKKPLFRYHVQEFNAGELFFILKMYYRKVELYSAPNIMKTDLLPVGIYSTYDKLFAYCER